MSVKEQVIKARGEGMAYSKIREIYGIMNVFWAAHR